MEYSDKEILYKKKAYLYAFSETYGSRNRFLHELLSKYGNDPEKAFLNELAVSVLYGKDVFEEYEKLLEKDINVTFFTEDDYPLRLRDIPDPPFALFYKGKLPTDYKPAVSVIGARDCSEYGRYVARILGEAFGKKGQKQRKPSQNQPKLMVPLVADNHQIDRQQHENRHGVFE